MVIAMDRASQPATRPRWTSAAVAIVIALAVLVSAAGVSAAPKAELWPRWTRNDPASRVQIDHGFWSDFLARYRSIPADGIPRLAYGKVAEADKAGLDDYVGRLAAIAVGTLSRDEQRAYWINLYNALTVKVVLDAYPVDSIKDIKPGFFSFGPWDEKRLVIEGEKVSLNDIEHRILRPIWKDPRLHYAVNCASLGCPDLAAEAYSAANAEHLLDAGAKAYVNHPRGVSVEKCGLKVSSIYVWFEADFGGTEEGVIGHLRKYAAPELRAKIDAKPEICDDAYDWRLNE